MKRLLAMLLIVGMLLAGLLVAYSHQVNAQTTRMGGWADSIVVYHQGDPGQALLDLDNGNMQMYLYYLRTVTQIQAAQQDPNIGLITAGGSTDPIFVNPVQVNQTKAPGWYNPFVNRQVREALNYLVDRSFIAREFFGGSVLTQTTLWYSQTPEFGRDPVFFSLMEQKYAYNPDTARAMIFEGLATEPGVTYDNGQWLWNGNPIVIKIEERIEDTRLQIGEYVAAQLRTFGFQVEEDRITGGTANNIVYGQPADAGNWMLYTEGWATTALTAYPDSDPDFYYCGGEGSPIWTVSGGSYTADPALADVCHKLLFAQYSNATERQSLIEQSVQLGLQQGIRIWTVAGATFPYAKKTEAPFVYDLAAGPWSYFSGRTARLLDSNGNPITGGTVRLGNRLMFVGSWNPWGGFVFLYDYFVQALTIDPGVYPDPHTGLYVPIRENFSVQTAGPAGTLAVPSGAYMFDASYNAATTKFNNTWNPVASGATATSKVTFTFTFGNWHDGQPMNMNDVLYSYALAMRRYPGGSGLPAGDVGTADPDATLSATKLLDQALVGLRVVNSNTLDVYLNYWHIDPTYIAATADAFPAMPWDVSEAAMETVIHGQTAISEVTADSRAITALDMAKGDSMGFMNREIANNMTTNWVAPGFASGPYIITTADANARWAAVNSFFTTYGHYFISNGPYLLASLDLLGETITLNNFAGYPFAADHWDSLLVPKVPQVAIGTAPQVVPGLPVSFNVTATVGGSPYDNVSMRWLVVNPATSTVLLQGNPTRTGTGTWKISLSGNDTGQFVPGAYTLQTITVGAEAAVPVFTTKSFVVIPALAYFQALLGTQLGEVNNAINNLQNQLNSANQQVTNANNQIGSLTGLLYVAVAVAVVSLVIAALSIVTLMRRLPKAGGGKKEPPETMEESPKGPEEL